MAHAHHMRRQITLIFYTNEKKSLLITELNDLKTSIKSYLKQVPKKKQYQLDIEKYAALLKSINTGIKIRSNQLEKQENLDFQLGNKLYTTILKN